MVESLNTTLKLNFRNPERKFDSEIYGLIVFMFFWYILVFLDYTRHPYDIFKNFEIGFVRNLTIYILVYDVVQM